MTITILTPEGALPARDAPLQFSTTDPVVAVMVELTPPAGPVMREGVYDGTDATDGNGTFAALYSTSTIDGQTWTIRRSGGWPAGYAAQLRVKPATIPPPLPTEGQAFGALIDVDFTTAPPQTFTAAGTYTIGGCTWWAKNPQNGTWTISSNGWQMQCTVSTDVGYWASAARQYILPLANVPGWKPEAPTQIWAVQEWVSGSAGIMVGMTSTTSDTVGMTAAQGPHNTSIAPYSQTNTQTMYWTRNNLRTSENFGTTYTFPWTTLALGLLLPNAVSTQLTVDFAYTGAKLPPASPFSYSFMRTFGHSARPNPCVWLAPDSTNGIVRLKRLAILQPKLAA